MTKKELYLECSAGAAGNMIAAALLDCGLSLESWKKRLQQLPLGGYELLAHRVDKQGISSLQVKFKAEKNQPERRLPEIEGIIRNAPLSSFVREKSISAFRLLARAEARVHGVAVDQVHFHELGAVDAILDIVGSLLALEMLEIDRTSASALPLGKGWVDTSHGRLPLPAPATAEILKECSIPCYGIPVEGETVTPTGAALLGTISLDFINFPPLRIEAIGCGAGEREHEYPNILRAFLGTSLSPGWPASGGKGWEWRETEREGTGENGSTGSERTGSPGTGRLTAEPLTILEANIDDLNPEIYEHVMEQLFNEGALDAYLTPIQMKKNRPAIKITVLSHPHDAHRLGQVLLRETTTLGYRRYYAEKNMLPRTRFTVETPWGPVYVKAGGEPPHYENIAPEYGDCLKIAREQGVPLKKIYQTVWKILGGMASSG